VKKAGPIFATISKAGSSRNLASSHRRGVPQQGFKAAEQVAQQEPRSLLGLMQLAREPETRRAFEILLTIANRVGSQLGPSG
jgi:uncharacterized protein YjgD (DUF1641 family)